MSLLLLLNQPAEEACGPIAVTELTAGGTNTDGVSASTASITPPADTAIFVFVSTLGINIPVVTGCGITWTQVVQQRVGVTTGRVLLFRGLSSSPSTGALTFTAPSSNTAWAWTVVYVDDADVSTAGAASAVGFSDDAASLTGLNLSFVGGTNSGVLAGFVQAANTTLTPEAGYTGLTNTALSDGLTHRAMWREDNESTPSMTSGSGAAAASIAIEVIRCDTIAAQAITASEIESEEAFGTLEIEAGALTLSPTGIASAEAVGSETWCGNTYYVSTAGNDANTGRGMTEGTAWRNVSKVLTAMPRYGIAKLLAGTYSQAAGFYGPTVGRLGDFLVMNYPGQDAIIELNALSTANTFLFNFENVPGVSFVGGGTRVLGNTGRTVSYDGETSGSLTLRKGSVDTHSSDHLSCIPAHAGTAALIRFYYDATKTGSGNLYGHADKVRIRGVNFGAVNGYAITAPTRPSPSHEVNDVIIEGCEFEGAGTSVQLSYCDGVYIQENVGVATLRMIDDSSDSDDNGGVHFVAHRASHNFYIRYNQIENARAYSRHYGFDGGGVEFFGNYDTDVSYNTFVDCEGGCENGTPNRTSFTMNNNAIHHNIFRGRFAWGDTLPPGSINSLGQSITGNDSPVILHRAGTNYKLYNNTFDLTGPHGNAVRMQYATTGNWVGEIDNSRVENNLILLRSPDFLIGGTTYGIALEIQAGVLTESGIVVDYNNIWSDQGDERVAWSGSAYYTRSQLTAWRAATTFGDNDIWADPVVLDADDGDYHLEATSPLIDAGAVLTPYTDGYIGAAPDIGRFEYTTLPLQVTSVGAVASLEAFGTAVLTTGAVTITVSGIASAEAIDTPDVHVGVFDAGDIASEEAFGSVSVAQLLTSVFDAGGIASEEAFGTGGVAGVIVGAITPPNIVSQEAFGSPTLVHSDVGLMALAPFRYVVSLEHDLVDANALWEPLYQGGGSAETSAAGAENLGQSRDYEAVLGLGWELTDAHMLTAEFSLYFKEWENPPTAGAFDVQIRYMGTALESNDGGVTSLPFWWDPEELTAMPLVAHLPNYLIVQNARNTFINDTLLTDPSLGIDMSDPVNPHFFVVVSSDYLVSLDPVAEGTSEVASWIASGAYLDTEDKLTYEPQLAVTYLVYAEGTILPASITSLGGVGDDQYVILEPYILSLVEYPILSEEAFGEPTVAGAAVTITVTAIESEEAFGSTTVVPGAVSITITAGIESSETFGDGTVTPGTVTITLDGIASEETFGTPAVLFLISPVGITSAEAFSLRTRIGVVHAPRGATGAIEYVVEIYNSGTGFGPGTKIGELWESRNLGWSRYDRLPGKGFLTLYQDSPHLSLFSPLTTHVKITRVTPVYDTQVYAGEFVDYDSTGDDVVLSFFDYVSLFAVSRSGYKTMYPKKRLGTEIAQPEIQAALSATYSPLGFVTMGTIQDPVGMDGTTGILTNEQFGTMDQLRLQLLWDLSEMGRVNTTNHVTFEISRTPPYVVNFWKNRGTNQNFGLILNGSVDDYQYLPNWTRYRNDLATLGTTTGGGATEIVKTNETAASVRGRRQDVATIKTLLGITSSAVELDQQHAATSAMLTALTQRTPMLQVNLVRDALAPFEGWEICDTAIVEIDQGVDHIVTRQRIVGVRGIYTEAGEDMGLILEPIPS